MLNKNVYVTFVIFIQLIVTKVYGKVLVKQHIVNKTDRVLNLEYRKTTYLNETEDTRKMEGYVVGGALAKISDYPHSGRLSALCSGESWACGVSIINQKLVLTAAHCVSKCKKSSFDFMLHFGSEDYRKAPQNIKGQKFLAHHAYEIATHYADIAVIYLGHKIKFGPNTKRVILKRTIPSTRPLKASVAGWGLTDENGSVSRYLKWTEQWVQTNNVCVRGTSKMAKGMLCAREGKGSYPFKGDSGSALITSDFHQIGVVSYRPGGQKDLIYYTDTAYHYDWILDKCTKMYCL